MGLGKEKGSSDLELVLAATAFVVVVGLQVLVSRKEFLKHDDPFHVRRKIQHCMSLAYPCAL
jgi:hypothetical protein